MIEVNVKVEENKYMPPVTEDHAVFAIGNAAGVTHSKLGSMYDDCLHRVKQCIEHGHHSVLEHVNLSLYVLCDRGTSHALVRHRHTSFTQESTLYTKYKEGIEIVALPEVDPVTKKEVVIPDLTEYYLEVEKRYMNMLAAGVPNTVARDILPNALATRLYMTTNLREWFRILKLRKSPADSVRMHEFAFQLEKILYELYPEITKAMIEWKGLLV